MSELSAWIEHGAQMHDVELKRKHVVPIIESLDYAAASPIAIDVGSGNWSLAGMARRPWPQEFRVASIDSGLSETYSRGRSLDLQADINAIINGQDEESIGLLEQFIADNTEIPAAPMADLVVYSDLLNYVDFKKVMAWFDAWLKPGGFMVIANMPERGIPKLFAEARPRGNRELVQFIYGTLGHKIVKQQVMGLSRQPETGYLVLATQKPHQPTV